MHRPTLDGTGQASPFDFGMEKVYQDIKAMHVPVTYVVIEQLQDGKGQYDIFRLSELSYLEHANRAYVEGTSCDE